MSSRSRLLHDLWEFFRSTLGSFFLMVLECAVRSILGVYCIYNVSICIYIYIYLCIPYHVMPCHIMHISSMEVTHPLWLLGLKKILHSQEISREGACLLANSL